MNYIYLLLIVFLTFIYFGCNKKSPKVELGLNQQYNFIEEEYQNVLHNLVKNYSPETFNLFFADTLKIYYSLNNYKPIIAKSYEDKPVIDSLISVLSKSEEHGIDPNRYQIGLIERVFDSTFQNNLEPNKRYEHLAELDFLLSHAILKYAFDLRYGVLNPKDIFPTIYFNMPVADSLQKKLFEPLEQSSIHQYLNNIQPKNPKYKLLQTALQKFESLKNIQWKKIPVPNRKIKLGDTDSLLEMISEKLILLDYLDTAKTKITNYHYYDSVIENSVRKFQEANGLAADGIISRNTIDKLNTSPEEYIKKIKINLERFRWFDYSDTSRYILVNIPEFKLHAFENGEEKFEIKVCTGRRRSAYVHQQLKQLKGSIPKNLRLEDWETPVLYSQISHLVLNPTWTVPKTIMREEIASKVKRDSAYLKKANFKVYKDGKSYDPALVKVEELYSGNKSYTIIQNPGAGNALGKIKFMFDNPFGVYLHDTPTRPPFNYANRAVSHGCVRVEKPLLLADFILNENSDWTLDYLKIETGYKVEDKTIIEEFKQKRNELRKGFSYGQTTEVRLKQTIPVFLDYYTAWVDKNGIINFRDDVYRQDQMISELLFEH